MKIFAPNHTQTPNELFDHWLPHLSESELKVLLVIFRKTFGWHKVRDKISISQLTTLTGLGKDAVINAGKTLHQKGLILREVIGSVGKQETYYELVITENSNNSDPSEIPPPPSRNSEPPPVGNSDIQKKLPKETSKENNPQPPSNSESKSNVQSAAVFDFLVGIGLSNDETQNLSREYQNDPESLRHGVKYATHKDTRIKTTLIQTIRWAAKQKPEIPKQQDDKTTANKQIAEKYKSIAACPRDITFEALVNHVEIIRAGNYQPTIINYSENGFEEQLKNALRKYDIRDKTKPINKEMTSKIQDLFEV